jgi:hypothetical protein
MCENEHSFEFVTNMCFQSVDKIQRHIHLDVYGLERNPSGINTTQSNWFDTTILLVHQT